MSRLGSIDLQRFAGWLLVSAGIPSSTVPALFAQNGLWSTSGAAGLGALLALAAALCFSAWQGSRMPKPAASTGHLAA